MTNVNQKKIVEMTGEEFQLTIISALNQFQEASLERMPEMFDKIGDSLVDIIPKIAEQVEETVDKTMDNLNEKHEDFHDTAKAHQQFTNEKHEPHPIDDYDNDEDEVVSTVEFNGQSYKSDELPF
tara:strand:- start:286 stop:660 length:375 start_codon:yes stop_codon:yes gene_type:complete